MTEITPEENTVLVIDDEEKILDIVEHFLENEGYEVLAAQDPEEGIIMAQEEDVDLLILDIMMPEMSGYEVYEVLQEREDTRGIPVLMLTAQAVIEDTPKEFFYGLYGFISKPFSKVKLLDEVENILELTEEGHEGNVSEAGE